MRALRPPARPEGGPSDRAGGRNARTPRRCSPLQHKRGVASGWRRWRAGGGPPPPRGATGAVSADNKRRFFVDLCGIERVAGPCGRRAGKSAVCRARRCRRAMRRFDPLHASSSAAGGRGLLRLTLVPPAWFALPRIGGHPRRRGHLLSAASRRQESTETIQDREPRHQRQASAAAQCRPPRAIRRHRTDARPRV